MQLKLINNYEDFYALKNDWNSLLQRIESSQVFYFHQWADCYLNYYDPSLKEHLSIIAGYENKELILIFPFIYLNGVVNFITKETSDYNLIYVDKRFNRYKIIEQGLQFLLQKNTTKKICLCNIPACSELFILQDVFRKNGYSAFLEESVIAPKLKIEEGMEGKFNKKQLSNIRRLEKRLEKEHKVRIETASFITEEQIHFVINNRSKKYNDSQIGNKNVLKFYMELQDRIGSNMLVNTLYIDNVLAAVHFGFKDEKKVYYYIPIYDEKYSRDGIGLILLNTLITEQNEGIIFDFLKGNEEYKFYWCDECEMNFHLLAYRKGRSQFITNFLYSLKNTSAIRKIFGR